MAEVVLLDTGGLIALTDRREQFHDWARAEAASCREPFLCSSAVLTEAAFVFRHHPLPLQRIHAQIEAGNLLPMHESTKLWKRCFELMERYSNVPMSFADAGLVAMAEMLPGSKIFTLDRDFLIYRDEDGEPLALIAPFHL